MITITLKYGLTKYLSWVEFTPTSVFISSFYGNTIKAICLHAVWGHFHTAAVQLSIVTETLWPPT